MRILNAIMLILFLLSCIVQYNDPDGGRWVFYYGVAALFAALGIANVYTPWAAVAALGFYIGAAFYLPGWSIETVKLLREPKMSSNDVELAREAFGMLICAVWMTVLTIIWYRRRKIEMRPESKMSESGAEGGA